MPNYSQELAMKVHTINGDRKIEVDTTLKASAYEAVKNVLKIGGLSAKGIVHRKGVPLDQQVRGTGTAASFKKGLIYLVRDNQGTACIEGLIPKDEDKQAVLKTALMSLNFGGEKPTNVTFQLRG